MSDQAFDLEVKIGYSSESRKGPELVTVQALGIQMPP